MSNLKAGPGEQFGPPANSGITQTPSTAVSGLSSRQVVFGSPSGGIAQMASFQIDSTLAYLGIGTSAPGADIHIQHGGTTAAGITVQQTTNQEAFLQTIVSVAGAANGFGLFQESTRLHLRVSDTAGSTVGASLVTFERSGNVGIGTTAPTGPLHVVSGTTGTLIVTTNNLVGIGAALTTIGATLHVNRQPGDGNILLVSRTTLAAQQPAFNVHSTGSTVKIGFWSTAGTTRPSSYTPAGVTTVGARVMATTITTVAGLMSAAERENFNLLIGNLRVLVQDFSLYGLLST